MARALHWVSGEASEQERALAEESITRRLRRIIEDAQVRRDLLWLQAQEKEDAESIESLERADPELRARMEVLLAETRPDLMEDRRQRREEFARLWRQRFDSELEPGPAGRATTEGRLRTRLPR